MHVSARRAGSFRIVDRTVRVGAHVGWVDAPSLDMASGELRVALRAVQPPALDGYRAVLSTLECRRVLDALEVAPCALVKSNDRDTPAALVFEWVHASNSGTANGKLCGLDSFTLSPLPRSEAERLVDHDPDSENEAWRLSVVDALIRGVEADEARELELPGIVFPSVDRLIRAATQGAVDEEAVLLGLELERCARADGWLRRTFQRRDCAFVEWDAALQAAEAGAVWTPAEGPSPWGPVRRLRLPAVDVGGLSLPEETQLVVADAPDDE